jgi:hypothetical protein
MKNHALPALSLLAVTALMTLAPTPSMADTTSPALSFIKTARPSLQEFLWVKKHSETALASLLQRDWPAKQNEIKIHVLPKEAQSDRGSVHRKGPDLSISASASPSEIEGGLLLFFDVKRVVQDRTYLPGGASAQDFLDRIELIESIIPRFTQNDLTIDFKRISKIWIDAIPQARPKDVSTGPTGFKLDGSTPAKEDEQGYVAVSSTESDIERFLMRYTQP